MRREDKASEMNGSRYCRLPPALNFLICYCRFQIFSKHLLAVYIARLNLQPGDVIMVSFVTISARCKGGFRRNSKQERGSVFRLPAICLNFTYDQWHQDCKVTFLWIHPKSPSTVLCCSTDIPTSLSKPERSNDLAFHSFRFLKSTRNKKNFIAWDGEQNIHIKFWPKTSEDETISETGEWLIDWLTGS